MRFALLALAGAFMTLGEVWVSSAQAQPPILPYPSPNTIPRQLPGMPQAMPLATVRGQLVLPNQPAVGVPVNLYNVQLGYSGYSYSGPDGMYFLNNIPPGDYDLLVWVVPGHPLAYRIRVTIPNTDIAPIQIPR